MSDQQTENTLQLAQELVDHLPKMLEGMNVKLKYLVSLSNYGTDSMTEIEIIDLLSSHEITRRLMRKQAELQNGQEDITLGGDTFANGPGWAGAGLAGNPGWVSPSQKWFCPENTCDHWVLVLQEGEDPPICEQHNVEMVRTRQKRG